MKRRRTKPARTTRRQSQPRKGAPANFSLVRIILFVFLVLLLYTFLKVETNVTASRLQQLKAEEARLRSENDKLRAEVKSLSSYSRITKIAKTHLGLEDAPDQVREIVVD